MLSRVFGALFSAAQQGRLQRAVALASKMVKNTPCVDGCLAETLSVFCKQNLSSVAIAPVTLEGFNNAAIAFGKIRKAQALGLDPNVIGLV